MKPISTRFHGLLDYAAGMILILPWIAEYFQNGKDTWLLALVGATTIILSLFTDYEYGLVKLIPMKLHLFLDVLMALFLVAVPFLFPLVHYYFYWPMLLGIGELVIILLSASQPYVHKKVDENIIRH
jgi:hypothetical protein